MLVFSVKLTEKPKKLWFYDIWKINNMKTAKPIMEMYVKNNYK